MSRSVSYTRVPLLDEADSDSDSSPQTPGLEPVSLSRLSATDIPDAEMGGYGGVQSQRPSDLEVNETIASIQNAEGKTLYEKKCMLVNKEMNAMGMGRYQWCIWALCGFGYLLDLMWAQAFGLVLQPLMQELGFEGSQSGNITASFNAGLTAGAAVWGILVDIIGMCRCSAD